MENETHENDVSVDQSTDCSWDGQLAVLGYPKGRVTKKNRMIDRPCGTIHNFGQLKSK